MRELTLANAMQNIRVMKYLYMAVLLGDCPRQFSCRHLYDRPVSGNVSYLTQNAKSPPHLSATPPALLLLDDSVQNQQQACKYQKHIERHANQEPQMII
jgi:hypothetical protein